MDDIDRNLSRIRAGLQWYIHRKGPHSSQPSPPERTPLEPRERPHIPTRGSTESPPEMRLFARVLQRIGAILRGAGRNAQNKS